MFDMLYDLLPSSPRFYVFGFIVLVAWLCKDIARDLRN